MDLTINLNDREETYLRNVAAEKDVTLQRIMISALQIYQLVQEKEKENPRFIDSLYPTNSLLKCKMPAFILTDEEIAEHTNDDFDVMNIPRPRF